MKLSEIDLSEMGEKIPSQTNHGIELSSFKNFERYGVLYVNENLKFLILKSEPIVNTFCYKLTQSDEDIFYFIAIEWENNLQVKRTWMKKTFRNKGIATQFYKKLFQDGFNLISDFELSPESVSIWKQLLTQYPNSIYLTTNELSEFTPMKNINDYFKKPNFLIMLKTDGSRNAIPNIAEGILFTYELNKNLP